MTPYITELLSAIDKNPELLNTQYKDNYAIKAVIQYAFDKTLKLMLPEGEPPYKKDDAPLGMAPANFYQQVKKLYVFTRSDLQPARREQLFVQLLEGLHPSEADICIMIKDQNLTTKYPNITADLVVKTGWVAEENIFRQSESKPAGKALVVNLSDSATTKESFGKPAEPKETTVETGDTSTPKKGRGRPKKVNEAKK